MTTLASWQNFYVIVGSSAGALIGLQFVVLSLITGMRTAARLSPQGTGAFATPAIVHFGVVLGLSAVLCAPWDSVEAVSTIWGLLGIGGLVYVTIIVRRIRAHAAYRPEFEDWLFHVLLPYVAYLMLALSACTARLQPRETLFGVGATALLLLFSGIHNAWDTVTYHIFVIAAADKEKEP
jgi:hypothetical protein